MSEDLKKVRDSALRVSGNPAFQAMEIANVSKKKKKKKVPTQTAGSGHPKDKESEKRPGEGGRRPRMPMLIVLWLPCWGDDLSDPGNQALPTFGTSEISL